MEPLGGDPGGGPPGDFAMLAPNGGDTSEPAAGGGRHRRLTLAPGDLLAGLSSSGGSRAPVCGSRFDVLVEDAEDSSDDSCSSEVPFEAAMDVLDPSPSVGQSAVGRRDCRSDEELAQEFWSEIGFPTPASRFWEACSSPDSGKPVVDSLVCRYPREESSASPSGKERGGTKKAKPSPPTFPMPNRPRAGTWRGPIPPRRITPPPVLGQFLERAKRSPSTAGSSARSFDPRSGAVSARRAVSEEDSTRPSGVHGGGTRLHEAEPAQLFSWAGLSLKLSHIWLDSARRGVIPHTPRRLQIASVSSAAAPSSSPPVHAASSTASPPSRSAPALQGSSASSASSPSGVRWGWRPTRHLSFAEVAARPMAGTPTPPRGIAEGQPQPQGQQLFVSGQLGPLRPPVQGAGRPPIQAPGMQAGGRPGQPMFPPGQQGPVRPLQRPFGYPFPQPAPGAAAAIRPVAPPYFGQLGGYGGAPLQQQPLSFAPGPSAPKHKKKKKKGPVQPAAPGVGFQGQVQPGSLISDQQVQPQQGQILQGYGQPPFFQFPNMSQSSQQGQYQYQPQQPVPQEVSQPHQLYSHAQSGAPLAPPQPVGQTPRVTIVPEVGASEVVDAPKNNGKAKKGAWCWKCSVDSHASKDCKVKHYCYICDKIAHPTKIKRSA